MITVMIRMIMRVNKDIPVAIRLCFNREDRISFSNRGDNPLEGNSSFILGEAGKKKEFIEISYVGWDMASMFTVVKGYSV